MSDNDPEIDNYKETFETWNKVASQYQEKFMDLDLYNHSYDFVCNAIAKEKAEILEIGCGPGNITKYLLSKRPDFNIYGIDIAPNMIGLAEINNPTASFGVMDVREINKLPSKYDGIVCGFCLPYLSLMDCEKLISDCFILLNENGVLYLSFVEGDPDNSGFHAGSTGDRCYFYFHNSDEIKKRLIQNNFAELNKSEVRYKKADGQIETHSIFTAKKKTASD